MKADSRALTPDVWSTGVPLTRRDWGRRWEEEHVLCSLHRRLCLWDQKKRIHKVNH